MLPAAALSLIVTVAFCLLLRPVAPLLNLTDKPGGRKRHTGVVPVIGGVAMLFGILAGFVISGVSGPAVIGALFSMFLLVLVGVFDDSASVPPGVRLLIQTATIIVMVFSARLMLYSLGNPFGLGEILLGPVALVGTLMVGITVINSYNLVDGADGLAGTLVAIPLATVIALCLANDISAVSSAIVLAAVLAYLVFNFPIRANRPIRTFMGDAGSTMLGFVVFWEVLRVSQGSGALITPVAGLWLASIPVYDSLTCFVLRIRKGRSPFTPGRDHFHHELRRGGFSGREKLAILGGLQAIYAVVGVGASLAGVPDVILFAAWSVLGLTQRSVIRWISIRHRKHLLAMLRAGRLDPNRAKHIRELL